MNITEIVMVIASFGSGVLLIARMRKENKVFIPVGVLCLLFGCYLLLQALCENEAVVTAAGWVMRGLGVLLIIMMALVLRDEKAKTEAAQDEGSAQELTDGQPAGNDQAVDADQAAAPAAEADTVPTEDK